MQGNYWEIVLLAPWDSDEVQECKVFPGGLDIGSECRRGSQDPHRVRNEKKNPTKHNFILAEENKRVLNECGMEGKSMQS